MIIQDEQDLSLWSASCMVDEMVHIPYESFCIDPPCSCSSTNGAYWTPTYEVLAVVDSWE